MIADLSAYPAMRPSGAEWLGDVPEHWPVMPLWSMLRERVNGSWGGEPSDAGIIARCIRGTDFDLNSLQARVETAPERSFGETDLRRRRLNPGDLVMSTSGGSDALAVGAVVEFASSACAVPTNFAAKLVPSRIALPRYLVYLHYALNKHGVTHAFTKKVTIANLDTDAYLATLGCLPSLDEQRSIVRFLDCADRRIRRAVRAKRKLIALLNEQKQVAVERAVLRGLDTSVLLKASGLGWLGDVPGHWEVRPAKAFFREVDERSETGTEELLSVSHITGVTPRREKNVTMFMASSYVGQKTCEADDLVINTMWAWMGALGVARQRGIVSSSYGVYRPLRGSGLTGEFAELLLRTTPYVGEYLCRSTGIRSSRLRLYPDQFLAIKLICPPVDEQRAILDETAGLRDATARAVAVAEGEIELLREYRTRLIRDVVTGKLDVRDAAAELPDEIDEPEPLDEIDAGELDETDDAEPVEVEA